MHVCATWLWGSCAAHYREYDPQADMHALAVAGLEVGWEGCCVAWLVGLG